MCLMRRVISEVPLQASHWTQISTFTDELMKYIINHISSVEQRVKSISTPVSSSSKACVQAVVVRVTPPCGHKMAAQLRNLSCTSDLHVPYRSKPASHLTLSPLRNFIYPKMNLSDFNLLISSRSMKPLHTIKRKTYFPWGLRIEMSPP